MNEEELRAAAQLLREILARIEVGGLTAPRRVVARLEGVVIALDSLAGDDRPAAADRRDQPSDGSPAAD